MATKYLFGLALLLLALALLVVTSVALGPGLAIKGKPTPAQFVYGPTWLLIEAGAPSAGGLAQNPAT